MGRMGLVMVAKFIKIKPSDTYKPDDLIKLQDNIQASLLPIIGNNQYARQSLTSVTLTAGQVNKVAHKLARQALGRVIIYQSADARIWDSQKPDSVFFYLNTSTTCTVSLEVF
jgi:hypothetical protein